jgi:UDP-N-acetylmuramoyl-L-alanyl-D-glutamate--2,6-diaminopimelate ligase
LKTLSDILFETRILHQCGTTDLLIHSLHNDSRDVVPGSLFFAVKGTHTDGHAYIDQAVANGAIAVICEIMPEQIRKKVTFLEVEDCAETMGIIASNFHGNPSGRLNLIGVTGTNGKTTTVTLLFELFRRMGKKAGLISTIINRINDKVIPSTHTTPDSIRLNHLLSKMADEGCTHCFMEVSSHAVEQKRIAGLTFHGGIFTNITHDHLDYHKTFDSYLKAKKTFFNGLLPDAFALVNKDDRNGMVMVQNTMAKTFTYSILTMADFRCRIVENRFQGLILNIGGVDCTFRLIGKFNAYNLLVVYATAELLGADTHRVLEILTELTPVDGRFNAITSKSKITAIVDYAHTPDALKNVLETINAIRSRKGHLITVVGAGGNRDTAKRPVMAKIACQFSNKVILTSDNPRYERPEDIIEEMKKGVETGYSKKTTVIVNRKKAIRAAVMMARPGDIILVAGKGHEKYQEVEGVKYPFDDRQVLEEMLETDAYSELI